MKKLVAGLVVVGFGAAVVLTGRPIPVSNAALVGPGGFSFQMQQMQPISLPQIKIDVPILQQERPEAIVERPVVAGVKAKHAVQATAVEQTQTQIQASAPMLHSCSGR
jgi:hypothetical protein